MAFAWQPVNFVNDDPSTPLSAENLAAVQAGITEAGNLADTNSQNTLKNPNIITDSSLNDAPDGVSIVRFNNGLDYNAPDAYIRGLLFSSHDGTNKYQILFSILNIETTSDGNSSAIYTRRYTGQWSIWSVFNQTDHVVNSVAQSMLSVASQQPMKLAALTTPESVTPELQSYIDERVQEGINDFISRFAAAYPMTSAPNDEQQTLTTEQQQADDNG